MAFERAPANAANGSVLARLYSRARTFVNSTRGRRRAFYRLHRSGWPAVSALAAAHRLIWTRRVRAVAVIGSYGKTTTARALSVALLDGRPFRHVPNNPTGVAQAALRWRRADRWGVIEAAIAHPGQMASYARLIRPDVAVVTGIGSEHGRIMRTVERTRYEKWQMVRALPPGGLAVLNGDDPNVMWMATRTRARVVTFGLGDQNDVRADGIRLDWPHGTRFVVHMNGTQFEARTGLIGRHMVRPALAALAVAAAGGLDMDRVLQHLAALMPELGRMQPVPLPNGAVLLRDDYKSALETVLSALETLAEIPAGRRIVVMGSVAEPPGRGRQVHKDVGRRVAEVADVAVFVGTSRRALASGAAQAGMPRENIVKAGSGATSAIEPLMGVAGAGDVILIKGRGSQRLERIALALQGWTVGCAVQKCGISGLPCSRCPHLAGDAGPRVAGGAEGP
jgi:UDP-N-acetylmuramyl pentapeptide synthase